MGLMDKVRQGAEQALSKAQQGVNQGKAKIDQAQAKHQWDTLLTKLGAAVYAEQRQGGPSDAVSAALAVLDDHVATHGHVAADDEAAPSDGPPAQEMSWGEAPGNGSASSAEPAGGEPDASNEPDAYGSETANPDA